MYATLLPKADKPFLFLQLRMPNAHVDVNTHPTKKEVRPSASISSHLTLTLTLMRCWQCDP